MATLSSDRSGVYIINNAADESIVAVKATEVAAEHVLPEESKSDDIEAAIEDNIQNTKTEFKRALDISEGQVKLIMTAVVLSLTVVFLDAFILSPALPAIAVELAANDTSYAWIASSLLFTMAVSVPIFGKASDIFGRRDIMILTNIIFLVGCFLGGFATSTAMLIAGRAVQGIGCGGLAVVASICVIDLFSPRNRGVYFSMIGTVSAVASAVGPIVGGVLATSATWRWCFWINIPIAAISFFLMVVFLKLPKPTIPVREGFKDIDSLGALSLTTSTILFLVGLQLGGGQYPWGSALVVCLIIGGALVFTAFLWIEGKVAKKPLIPLSIFMNVSRIATIIVMITQAIVSSGVKYFVILYFQLILGSSPLISAIYYLPYAIGLGLILPSIGWIIKRTGKYRSLMLVGAVSLTLGAGLLIDSQSQINWDLIIVPQLLLAVGVGLTYQSSTIAFQAQIKQAEATAGQSAFQLLRNFSQMISVILGQVIFQSQVFNHFQSLGHIGLNADFASQLTSGNTFTSLSQLQNLTSSQQSLVREILTASFRDLWVFYTIIAFLGLLIGLGITDVHME